MMMRTESWRKVRIGVEWTALAISVAAIAGFLGLLWRPGTAWIGAVLAAAAVSSAAYAFKGLRADSEDEMAELVAMRSGYLSHRLVMAGAAAMLVFGVPGGRAGGFGLLFLYALGQVSDAAFRRLQGRGREDAAPAWAWGILLLAMAAAGGLLWRMWAAAEAAL